MNATIVPKVTALCAKLTCGKRFHEKASDMLATVMCRRIPLPPNQIMQAIPIDDRNSTTG